MHKNQILRSDNLVYRVLELNDDRALVINCVQPRMPFWIESSRLEGFEEITENDLLKINNVQIPLIEHLSLKDRAMAQNKFASIGPILPVIKDDNDKNDMIAYLSEKLGLNRKTIIRRLYLYLVFQNICIYVSHTKKTERELTNDERNFRYVLNKYFYTRQKRTLKNCYLLLLREKYSKDGTIMQEHPSFHQFKYFYYKTRKLDSYYISREGRGEYERNIRPLLAHSREYFNTVGFGLADTTILDVYVLDESGKARRPYLAAVVDGYSSLCLGFAISFEGGDRLLRKLMLNVNANKVDYCKSIGVDIANDAWPSQGIPYALVSDNGADYTGSCFTQLTQLGIQIQTNKSHEPNMKPNVERFFGVIQQLIKPYLYKYGYVDKDGGLEKPKDNACLTYKDIETILCLAIIHYNSKRIINLPYDKGTLKPFANELFLDSLKEYPDTFILLPEETIILTMLPKTKGVFTRYGLKVGKLFYRSYGFVNDFLESKKEVSVTYDPENVSFVWILEEKYIKFTLIDSVFDGKSYSEVTNTIKEHHRNSLNYNEESIVSEAMLMTKIEKIIKERSIKNETDKHNS